MVVRFLIENPKIDVSDLIGRESEQNCELAASLTAALRRRIVGHTWVSKSPFQETANVTEIYIERLWGIYEGWDQHRDVIVVNVAILDWFPKDLHPAEVIPFFAYVWIEYWSREIRQDSQRAAALEAYAIDATSGWRFHAQVVEEAEEECQNEDTARP